MMNQWFIILGSILGPGGIIVALIERTRRENNRDHAYNTQLLKGIDRKVDKLDDRFNGHIVWHLDKES